MLSSVREDYKIEERLKDSGLHIRREGYIYRACRTYIPYTQDIYTVHAGHIYRTCRIYISFVQEVGKTESKRSIPIVRISHSIVY